MTARASAAAVCVAIVVAAGADASGAADASRWWAHVRYLADDSLEGREAGRPGYTRAAEYVADVWRRAGLEPAYAGQFLQPRYQFRIYEFADQSTKFLFAVTTDRRFDCKECQVVRVESKVYPTQLPHGPNE